MRGWEPPHSEGGLPVAPSHPKGVPIYKAGFLSYRTVLQLPADIARFSAAESGRGSLPRIRLRRTSPGRLPAVCAPRPRSRWNAPAESAAYRICGEWHRSSGGCDCRFGKVPDCHHNVPEIPDTGSSDVHSHTPAERRHAPGHTR